MNNQGKVWGSTSNLFAKNNVSIHRIHIKPGGYCSKHKHNHKYNMFYVEEGKLNIEVWKNDYDLIDITTLQSGEHTVVKPQEFHRFHNTSPDEAIVYEIYWTELLESDIERETVGGNEEV
jgi:mannose-6-phosphate isomerase-like protein (cupin superfamily)